MKKGEVRSKVEYIEEKIGEEILERKRRNVVI